MTAYHISPLKTIDVAARVPLPSREYLTWASIVLEYDSNESPQAHAPNFDPAYMPRTLVYRQNTATWRTVSYPVSDARFAKRQNGGADFRLAAFDWALVISHVTITREAGQAATPAANAPSPSPAPFPAPLGERAVFTYISTGTTA
jgi:hypothetical protein